MTTTMTTNCCGDILRVKYDGTMWVSPTNGQQHISAKRALRVEIEMYLLACGEDLDECADEIDALLDDAEMESAS